MSVDPAAYGYEIQFLLNAIKGSHVSQATVASNAGGTGAATETIVFIAPTESYTSKILINRVTVTPVSSITGAGTHWNIISLAQYTALGVAYGTPPAGTYTTQTSLTVFTSAQVNTSGIVLLPGETLTIKNTGNDSTGAAVPGLVVNIEYTNVPLI